jgi:hypothetical protein
MDSNAFKVLDALASVDRDEMGYAEIDGHTISDVTELTPADINDAVTLLVQAGLAEWSQLLGTAPYEFATVTITPRGRYQHENPQTFVAIPETAPSQPLEVIGSDSANSISNYQVFSVPTLLPPSPVGSPYGFQDADWETVTSRKSDRGTLFVVLGYQFKSRHFDASILEANLGKWFNEAVARYNALPGVVPCALDFRSLAAGYGEHLFNEIARDIISSDIALFETSDMNANVMVEMGVALTWGVRVLPVKRKGRPKPPSDISGQTWADYEENGKTFTDAAHIDKLVRMVERAIRKKGRA